MSAKILSSEVVVVYMKRKTVLMRQAYPIGFTILDRSKQLMYDQYYNKLLPSLKAADPGCDVTLNMTDTDSVLATIISRMSMSDIMDTLEPYMDYSNFPRDHRLYREDRKNALTYWKSEVGAGTVLEFAGLAAKSYSVRIQPANTSLLTDASVLNKCKGITRGYLKRIPFEDYKRCLDRVDDNYVEQYRILTKDHVIRTVQMNRRSFSSLDDKRFIMSCGLHSLAFGHRDIDDLSLKDDDNNICKFCEEGK